MNIGYFGSPDISAHLLSGILEHGGHNVVCVVSNPDKPKGRSGSLSPTAVSQVALEAGLPLYRYGSLRPNPAASADLSRHNAHLFLVFAYGRLIPREIFDLPPGGTLNLHGSILPELRGASPIQSAILAGKSHTGWTVQFINEHLDAGDIVSSCALDILPNESSAQLSERMLPLGIELTLHTLDHLSELAPGRKAQAHELATYCGKIRPEMAVIDWNADAASIHNLVRAFQPWPGARTSFLGGKVKIVTAQLPQSGESAAIGAENQLKPWPPGTFVVIGTRIFVQTGRGALEVVSLQPESRRVMSAADFTNGYRPPAQGVFA